MTTTSEIPLKATPQSLGVVLSGKSYRMKVKWNWIEECWVVDLADSAGRPLASGLAMVTGADMLGQLGHLGFVGQMFPSSDQDPDAVPTFTNLGTTGHLFYRTP